MNSPAIGREALVAGVLNATDRLVNAAGNGDWQTVDKTIADRRLMLEQLIAQEPQANEHGFLRALREAAAESEHAVAAMRDK